MANFIGGCNTGYESISDYRLYLDTSYTDVEFNSRVPNPIRFTELNNSYSPYSTTYPELGNFYTPKRTILDVISNNVNSKPFVDLISKYNLQSYLDSSTNKTQSQITAFVPVNGIDKLEQLIQSKPYRMENILKYHLVNYPILPVQLFNSINKVYSLFSGQNFTIGGDENNLWVIYPDNETVKNQILKVEKTDNGYVYYIQKPMLPYLY